MLDSLFLRYVLKTSLSLDFHRFFNDTLTRKERGTPNTYIIINMVFYPLDFLFQIAANTQHYKINIAKTQRSCYNEGQFEPEGTMMSDLGTYLKELRNELHLSLKDVQERCGVTDSKLSRLERSEGRDFSPLELKKLAQLYGVNVIPLYIKAGYLDESDLSEYQLLFENANLLNEEEHSSIQTQINLLTKGRQVSDNDF